MSSYLQIKKNNVYLCSFSRSHPLYQAVQDFVPYGKWTKITGKDVDCAIDEIDSEITKYKEAQKRERDSLPYLKTKEDIYEALCQADSFDEEIEEKILAKHFLIFLSWCMDEDTYELGENGEYNYDKPIKPALEWLID